MTRRIGFNKVGAGMVVAGALTLTSVFGGVVSADTDITIGVGELQEYTVSKSMDMASPKLATFSTNGSAAMTEEVAFYYNRIAFQYATTDGGAR